MNYSEAYQKLAKCNQTQLLSFYEQLNEKEQEMLLKQIQETDFSVAQNIEQKTHTTKRGEITPIRSVTRNEIIENESIYRKLGEDALKKGEVGAVLLAGGMGTRLGSDDPKGIYNVGVTKDLYIFECLIHNLLEVVNHVHTWIPLFIMTSDKNHEKTVRFLKEHKYFGYEEKEIYFFKQDMAPATDYNGKIYLESKGVISTSPNGNGGWFVSMQTNGLVDVLHERKLKWLNLFAVDNVLQKIADPVFVGAVLDKGAQAGSKVVRKASPEEKVGVMCLEDGKPSIVEYYELSEEMLTQRDEDGELAYNFGVTLNYLFSIEVLEKIASLKLDLHVVEKKITHINDLGEVVKPEEPNGYKFEKLVLDMIREFENCIPFEVVREQEFAPIKNKEGVDSVETARALLIKNGVQL